MKSMIKSVTDNLTFRLIVCGLMAIAAGTMIIGALAALAFYVHPIAALLAACVFVVVMGYYFDK